MSIEIERGHPVPAPRSRGMKPIYPFGKLKVGESFSVPILGERYEGSNDKALQRVMCAAAVWKRRKGGGLDFTTRIDRVEGVVRCWRTA